MISACEEENGARCYVELETLFISFDPGTALRQVQLIVGSTWRTSVDEECSRGSKEITLPKRKRDRLEKKSPYWLQFHPEHPGRHAQPRFHRQQNEVNHRLSPVSRATAVLLVLHL